MVITSAAAPSPSRLYEALERETERICAPDSSEVEALKKLVLFEFDESLLHSRPTLKLFLSFGNGDAATHNKMLATLNALSTVLALSLHLNAHLPLKVKLWRRLFESCVTLIRGGQIFDNQGVGSSWLWVVEDERFPAFSVSLNLREEWHVDAMVDFFTTPPLGHAMWREQLVEASEIAIGLELSGTSDTLRSLRLVEQLLDRVYASPTRQFVVNALGVSDQAMDETHFAAVLDLVKKSHETYHIEKLRVVDVIPEQTVSADPVLTAMHKVIAAACNTDSLVFQHALIAPSRLRSLDLSWNRLGIEHFAAFCSALRYGCPLDAISLTRVIQKVDAADRPQCWRWLAFGAFYPHSRKLNRNYNRITCVKLEEELLLEEYGEAFTKTLANPASELVYQANNRSRLLQNQATNELLLCTIQQGAKFYPTAKAGSQNKAIIHELICEMELETLCQEEEWTCAVLPGIGFGWVQNDQIVRMESETINSRSYRNDSGLEWTFDNRFDEVPPFTPELLETFGSMLEHIGPFVRSIEFVEVDGVDAVLPVILGRCVSLERLVLRGCELSDDAVDTLIDALSGDFGKHLLSLVLNTEYDFGDSSVEKLCRALSNPARTPALRELLVSVPEMNDQAYANFRRALEVNKRLQFVLLDKEDQYASGEDEEEPTAPTVSECQRIEVSAQGELIPSILPLRQKLALISAIQHSSDVGIARHGLDNFIVANIFNFAADRVVRRIIWGERFV